mmetsp:Transcript_32939/g.72784  ORF Transcript_32939/g.72784 Transcript_32939/m.72784 type:complete len:286 (+) Transcript_32939:553-1410(+)
MWTASPAAKAAPREVVSWKCGLTTGTCRISACICISRSFLAAPPSTRSTCRLSRSASRRMASSTSRDWKQMASSMARATWARVVKPVKPTITPRALSSQRGASSPEKAGTKYTPPLLVTDAASGSTSSGLSIMPMFFCIQLMPMPATATAPSNAYCVSACGPSLNATVVRRPWLDVMGELPVLSSMKQPVPYVFFASPATQRWPSMAAIWSPRQPQIGTSARGPSDTVPYTSELLTMRGSADARMEKSGKYASCHWHVRRSMSMVREAFVTSVTCTPLLLPPVSW